MSKSNYTVVSLTRGRIHKHTFTFARRIIQIMASDKTPEKTRAALRRTLQNLFNQTSIGGRASLANVNNVARVLQHTGYQKIHLGDPYLRAYKARIRMCRVIEAYDWATNPRLKKIAVLIANRRMSERRPRARRAVLPPRAPSIAPLCERMAA